MNRFISHFTNRLDAKGRVSIPASYRAALARDGFEGLYVYPSLDFQALDCGGNALIAEIDRLTATLTLDPDERDSVSTALFGTSEALKMDADGRIVLTEHLKTHTGIVDQVSFVGLGQKFQIWEPSRFRAHLDASRERLLALRQRIGAMWPFEPA